VAEEAERTEAQAPRAEEAEGKRGNGAEQADAGPGAAPQRAPEGAPAQPAPDPLELARQEAAERYERLLRLQAEFDNYKRRMHKEQSEMLKYAQLPLLRDLTGVVDDLERAIDHARNSDIPDHRPFVEGLEMVTKQIGEVFERFGMTRITAKGEPFDPRKHEAMKVVETDEFPENTIVAEFRTGYQLHERIVRPSMVVVSKKPQAQAGDDTSGNGAAQ